MKLLSQPPSRVSDQIVIPFRGFRLAFATGAAVGLALTMFLPHPGSASLEAVAVEDGKPQEQDAAEDLPAVDLGGFGSDELVEPRELPERGQLVFNQDNVQNRIMEHWDQYDWAFETQRWGHYQVVLTYHLEANTLGVQFHHHDTDTRHRRLLRHTGPDRTSTVNLGEVRLEAAGEHLFSVYTPTLANRDSFQVHEIRWIPVPAGEAPPAADNGVISLPAAAAVTWSEQLRYEPQEDKNCLGYWIDKEDWAEWEFEVTEPGTYEVIVHKGCADDSAGAEVAVVVGDQETRFTVAATGGFQQWQPVSAGTIELGESGTHFLALRPLSKPGRAVMDVLKVELRPAS